MPRKLITPTAKPPQLKVRPIRALWVALGLVALNLLVYAAVRDFQFTNWDDPSYITENPRVLGGLTWASAKWAVTTAYSPYWHPVTWLSHLLDVRLFGLDAGAHHVVNLLIHIANSVLLFGLLRRMTGTTGRSAFVAAMFAVHPLHVESVAWVTERKDVLSGFFWILTTWAYVAYVERRGWPRYLAVAGLFLLALMSKPMVVTLPIALLLLDVWPLRRMNLRGRPGEELARSPGPAWTAVIVEKLPLLAMSVGAGIATIIIQRRVGALATLGVLPWDARVANAVVSYVRYIWKAIWPANLAAFYPLQAFSAVTVLASALLLIGITAAAIRLRDRHPYLLVGWLWYLVTIAPVIGFLQAGEQAMADRFMYVPIIGLLLIVAWGVPELVRQVPRREVLVPAAAVLVVLFSTVAARLQAATWFDSITLWRHAVTVTEGNYRAYENLGQALRERGDLEEAEANYTRAIGLAPQGSRAYDAVIYNALGLIALRQGRTDATLERFAAAVRFDPALAEARNNLGNALASARRFAEATEHFRAAVAIKPGFTEAHVGLGASLVSQGKAVEAIASYREALRLDPALAEAHNGLGAALAKEGQDVQAMAEYEEALRLKPSLTTAHFNIAVVLIKQRRLEEARRRLETALAVDPGYGPARQALQILSKEL